MSVYRDPANRRGRRLLVISVVAALLLGALGGFLLARATEDDPTLADQVSELQEELQPAVSALELVPGHYEQGVRDGEVVEPAQYEGARGQAAAAADIVADVGPDLSAVSPDEVEDAERTIADLQELIEARAGLKAVEKLADLARGTVAALAGTGATDPLQ